MIVTFQNFPNLKFPLYLLPSDDWWTQDKVLFLQNSVIDDKNLPGDTLGIRRLQSGRKDLLPLTRAVVNVADLVHCRNKYFVDSEGHPLIYMKTARSQLKTYRIKKIEKKEVASLLWLYGWHTPFNLVRPPAGEPEFVRMLHYENSPWIIYDYVRTPPKDTHRRV